LITYENKGYDNKTYPKLMSNKLKVMGGPTPIYTPLGNLAHGSLYGGFHVCIDQGSLLKSFIVQGSFYRSFHVRTNQISFLKSFLTNSELRVNDDVSDDVSDCVGASDGGGDYVGVSDDVGNYVGTSDYVSDYVGVSDNANMGDGGVHDNN